MIERFRPIWSLKAVGYELYHILRRLLNASGHKKHAKTARIVAHYDSLKANENRYLRLLLGKYPDQAWSAKYVKAGMGLSVPGILAFHTLETMGLHSIWTSEATLDDCKLFLNVKHPFTTVLRHSDGTPHAVLVYRYSPRRKEFYFKDTLGSYNTRYRLHYGNQNWISEENFAVKNVGHPIHVMVLFKESKVLDLFRRHFRNRKHYWV